MKTYTIQRHVDGRVTGSVMRPADEKQPHNLHYNLSHLVYHSPDGFETGYGGSGPADLAISILADHFHERASIRPAAGRLQCWAMHQDFKEAWIAPNKLEPGEEYTITEEEIAGWIRQPHPKA